MMKRFLISLACLLVTLPALAAPLQYDESLDCDHVQKEGLQLDRNLCQNRGVDYTEFQLTRVYGQLRKALKTDNAREKTLVEAQRAWITWRDKEADLCVQAVGYQPVGSAYGEGYGSCIEGLNAARIDLLRMYLKQATGQ